MSQKDTAKAAIRFEGALTSEHSVTNTVIHQGLGWGMSITTAANISVSNTYIIGCKTFGLNIVSSNTITIDSIFVSDHIYREVDAIGMFADKQAAVAVCSYNEPDTACSEISV